MNDTDGQQHEEAEGADDQSANSAVAQPGPSKREVARALASKTASDLSVLGVPVPGSGRILRFSIARDSEAQIVFSGPITQEAIEKLSALLELQKDTFPTKSELERGANEISIQENT
jgi:hypothetical protein